MAPDVWPDVEHWGGGGWGPVAHGESEIGGRKWDEMICPWFCEIFVCASGGVSPPLGQNQLKKELVQAYETCYANP
jgi:hypothetical protein